ncbi:MAG: DUF3794 domain-containing protein [Clostridia bacterium]|nr:DUF3794 domain-containing protein [Clostridia bacterium]MDY5555717.1 DUF3794 domain-containing protein [Blautia sp.]
MLELKKEEVQMLREKSKAASQVTFDVDYNVPDAKPDMGRMIQSKADVSMDEVRLSEGRAFLKGNLNVDLLYVGEEEGKIFSLSARLPMDETINLEGIESGDKLCLKWDIEDLSLHIIHSRKLNIKAIVTFYATVDDLKGIRLPTALEDDSISVKKKTVRLMSLCVHKKDTMRVKDDINLASNRPNIENLLWYTIEPRGLDLRPQENAIKAKGELSIFVLYKGGDEDNPPQWLEYSMPFQSEAECTGCMEDMIPQIEVSVIHQSMEIKPDADGEERILQVDVVLELNMKLYKEEEHELLLDAYTPVKQCILHGKNEMLESLLVRNFSRCRLTERVQVKETQGKVLQLCHSCGKVKIDKTKITEDGIEAEGIIILKILYIIGNDDMPFYSMDAMIPFTHVVEAKGITPDCTYHLQADLEQLSTTMVDSNEIEVKAAVSLNALVLRQWDEFIIDQIEEQPLDMKKIEEMPGMTVYIVKPKDTLWDIAKRFYTTVDEITRVNELTDHNIRVGQPLLLVKQVKG